MPDRTGPRRPVHVLSGGAASMEMKKGAESAWAELKRAFDAAMARFK